VTGTTPTDGAGVAAFPAVYTLDFSEAILASSIDPGDLIVGGILATGVTLIDGDTLQFTLAPIVGDGTYNVSLSAGVLLDLQGTGNEAFSATFVVDGTPPILTSTAWNSDPLPVDTILPEGPLTFQGTFNEPLRTFFRAGRGTRVPGRDDVLLFNNSTGQVISPNQVNANMSLDVVTVDFAPLDEGFYTLVLISGDDAFEDAVGNDLDGEPLGPGTDSTPTGDGVAGGDYFQNFFVDFDVKAANPFLRLAPFGSLIAQSLANASFLHGSNDTDGFTFFAEAGETISAIATPGSATAALGIAETRPS